jgi:hypothetical protein
MPRASPAPHVPTDRPKKPNALIELGVTIVAPSLILMQFSDKAWLGDRWALLMALALPVGWGLWDGWRRRKVNGLSMIGIVSTLLTGGIGLLQLDAQWFAIKEGAIPALMGLVIAASAWTRHPLIHALVFDADLMDVERIRRHLAERRNTEAFEARLRQSTLLLAATFLFTAIASYVLARWLVTSAAGSEGFNQELGRLTLLSWPLVALPSMLMMLGLMFWLGRCTRQLTGLSLNDMFQPHH